MLTFRQRWQSGTIRTLANERRILLLTGPRQCCKITLSKNLDLGKVEYRTLDNKTQREAAVLDPHSFLIHRGDMLIIDEVQRVPSLLPAIKQVVDEDSRSGQFLLTGSAHVQALSSVQESLAGRIAKIRLRPLSEGEIREVAPRFLERAFVGEFNNGWADCNRDRILATALRGGFPEVIDLAPRARRRWHRDYVGALLEQDLRDVVQIRRRGAIRQLVEVLAGWSSKLINISSIGAKLSIQRATLESYINALEMLFIVERVPAWTKTDYGRVGGHSKLFMTDSGLMASILGWNADKITLSPDRLEKII